MSELAVDGYGCYVCRQTRDVQAGPKDALLDSDQERMLAKVTLAHCFCPRKSVVSLVE